MVKRRKLFQHSLNLISPVKLFLLLMNQKQKRLLISHWNLTLKKAILPCQTCQKSIAICVKKLEFGHLRQHLACQHTFSPLVSVLSRVKQPKHKMALKLVSSLQLHKQKIASTSLLILPFVSSTSMKTTSKSSILSHYHTTLLFLTSQRVPWKTGVSLPIVKFTSL